MSCASHQSPLKISAVIVAAGQGLRAGQPLPKQFAMWRGKEVLRHAAEALYDFGLHEICVAIPEGADALVTDMLDGLQPFSVVTGGATRQESVRLALEALREDADIVLIHDAARPDCPHEVITRLVSAVGPQCGAVPVLPVVDSMVIAENDLMAGNAQRETLRRVQTPQAFRYEDILQAHADWQGAPDAGDDAQVLRAAGGDVALVDGDERLHKLTFREDFMEQQPPSPPKPPRIGMGYDVHRLAPGEELLLCGIQLDHDKGLAGHSDADVALHAVVDAVLGAIAAGDIGQHFPPNDPQWKGARSSAFVVHAVNLAGEAGYTIGNVDLTIICEAPKIGPHRDAMRDKLAALLGIQLEAVSVKATTTEKLGFTGRGEGIAAQAVAMLISK